MLNKIVLLIKNAIYENSRKIAFLSNIYYRVICHNPKFHYDLFALTRLFYYELF